MTNFKLIKDSITSVKDFPVPGIVFRDITTLVGNPAAFQETVDAFVAHYKDKGITKVIGTESRGFIFGAPVALALGVPLVLVRKPGKLPRETVKVDYSLEYGKDSLELQKDDIQADDNVLVIDDLLATGGTLAATVQLVESLNAKCKYAGFVINLKDLPGQAKLEALGVDVFSLVEYEGE
ncbi:adenine phosphoribosyltransferase [Psittacicella melopsittaci]|uniref:Adenine phosphoribosyltransferase n=1 Tax=Psittacicella melopsittaci TaxID=2028576 RepID=A0A3A1Y3A1_9GAMM|nr:adenine phosphoribosyltransferase [Psittacicella melopsittaci]RIY31779.1 adenine phosphoribosyltransferase [Psittacicella melopsittaci]